MKADTPIKIIWYSQTDDLWLGLIEVKGHLGRELYRIRIERNQGNDIYFYNYKFERYSEETLSWDLGLTLSNYPIPVFLSIKEACKEQLLLVKPSTIVFVTDNEKRIKLFQYLAESILTGANVAFFSCIYTRKNCTIFLLANKSTYINRISELKTIINTGFDKGLLF